MTLKEFRELSKEAQADATWLYGVYLDTRTALKYSIVLYQIDCFYVELFFNADGNEITDIRSFASTEMLEPYLDSISLEDIWI